MTMDTRFIVTIRPAEKYNEIKGSCFDVINIPVTRIVDLEPPVIDYKPDVIVLTSEHGADLFFKYYNLKGIFMAIGRKTGDEIKRHGINPLIPKDESSYGLINLLDKYKDKRIAMFRSMKSNNIIRDYLIKNHFDFKEYFLYDIVPVNSDICNYINDDKCMGVVITSSMEAEIIVSMCHGIKNAFAIGRVTEEKLRSMNINVIKTGKSDFIDLIKEIDKMYCK
ncbi:uroporphyrinogen-III synthase [Picrophilus oshimae]|uniref:Uroporphyrinogen-III synthase n=1 Tax=Picrophilus torridus (strain ATCC 700027 / DSM 9790 / JCM 10055 / NBRC 100828 / KAW 2/3) TaxID=1122961 RepID=A0A8G2FY28_PICTO|nr:uroporphyrinogen-III synthase [Picrophilus oshimae]SMD31595.1 uroporphyrinogen-III synthase [Picrophilus oshimae DSM 9789]